MHTLLHTTMSISPTLIMASHLSYLLLVSSIALPCAFVGGVQQIAHTNISLDSSIHATTPPTSWFSPSGHFAFGFYPEGSGFSVGAWLITSPGNITVIWTAFRDEPPFPKNTTLKLTPQGLKLLLATSEDRLVSATISDAAAEYASMLDSGNFAVYSSSFEPLWETFDDPTDTIVSGQVLSENNMLISGISETNQSQGRFRLKMQSDGNLVLYPLDTTDTAQDAYWSTDTYGQDFSSLNLDSNGSLFLLGSNVSDSYNLKAEGLSTSSSLVYLARIDADGFFRLYSYNLEEQMINVVARFPDTDDGCMINGACGMNSYCSSIDEKLACLCLPGFIYLDPQQTSSGCRRNFTDSTGCLLAGGGGGNVTMESLENTVWSDNSYMTPSSVNSKEECRDACLGDCNCDGVLFSGTTCRKLKFPLMYGRRDTSQGSTVAYIKVGTGSGLPAVQGDPAFPASLVPAESKKRNSSSYPEIFIIVLTVGLAISLVAFGFILYRYRALRYHRMSRNREVGLAEELALRSFSYQELFEATRGFKEKLGNGSFGTVFKGALVSSGVSIAVAVKRLEKAAVEEGEQEFQAEMRAIGRTHHRNLVRLIGFCDEGTNRLLVYEFMSNGSLADLIFKPLATEAARPEWSERVRIALDVAKGIHYLHEECESRIIHFDIKPHNILMDDHWTAKIADFGMAKLMLLNQTRTFTRVRGTRGYLAPEWDKNAPITEKADIYSFGVVLLEIICCRRNLEAKVRAPEEVLLLEWVYGCYVHGELAKLVPNEEVDMRELERFVKVGIWCIQNEPALRPDMKKVVLMLEGNIQVCVPPTPSSVH